MDLANIECQEKPLGRNDICDFNPEFAVICSFFEQFGSKIDLELDIERLKNSIEDRENIDDYLIDIHVKLIKKIRRYFVRDQWEKALIRFASEYSYEDAYEIERLGYIKSRPSLKLELLRRLLDAQFEHDQKFKALINSQESNELRLQPTGRDLSGNTYWHNTDKEGNFRIFQEEPLDYNSWKVICKTPNELCQLIEELESNKEVKLKGEPKLEPYNPLPEIFPDLFVVKKESPKKNKNFTKTGRSKSTRRGKARGRTKKPNPLSTLKEEEENVDCDLKKQDDSHNLNSESNSFPISSPSSDNSLLEFQVRQTVEGIINKVVSSIDYFLFKPLTRNFTDLVDQDKTVDDEKPEINGKQSKPAQNKRSRSKKIIAEELPRRSSSRIQQLQQKKEQEEIQKVIELSKIVESIEDDHTNDKNNDSGTNDSGRKHFDENKSKKNRKKNRQRWRDTNVKKKRSWDKDDSDLSSTSSPTETDDEAQSENDLTINIHDNEDDEFACEEEDTSVEPVIIRRARTARQSTVQDNTNDFNDSSNVEEDKPCGRCEKSNDPEFILLCDLCDDGYHLACCIPPLMIVPDGDWFCPSCEHKTLLTKLNEIHVNITQILEVKERERMKRERLRATAAARRQAIREERSKDEIVPERRQRNFLHELNEPLALQGLDEELDNESKSELPRERSQPRRPKKGSTKRSKRRRRSYEDDDDFIERPRKSYTRRKLESDDETDGDEVFDRSSPEESSESERPKTRRARACVSYKFKEYDDLLKSAICGESDKDELSEERDSEPETCNYGRGKDMATIEALAYQQENGLLEQAPAQAIGGSQKSQSRKKSRRLNDLDAESEMDDATSDESFQASSATEAEEEDEITEVDSEGSSFDEIISRKYSHKSSRKPFWKRKKVYYDSDESSEYETRTRRAAAKQVSYRESTDDEELPDETKKTKKHILSSDDDSDEWKGSEKSDLDEAISEEIYREEENDGSSSDEIAPKDSSAAPKEAVSISPTPNASQAVKNSLDVPSGSKRIRLEKRETRPVYTMANQSLNDSIDEITVPTSPIAPLKSKAPTTRLPNSASLPDSTTNYPPQQAKISSIKISRSSGVVPSRASASSTVLAPTNSIEPMNSTNPAAARPVVLEPPPISTVVPPSASAPLPTPILSNPTPIQVQQMGQPHSMPPPYLIQSPMQPVPHMYHHTMGYQAPPMSSPHHPMPLHPYTSVHVAHPMIPTPMPTHPIVSNPIGELDQYCNQSTYPTNIFNSFNINVPPKNLAPPHPAPFYREDEVRPPPASSADRQRTW